MKICKTSYHMIKYVSENPGCTFKNINNHLCEIKGIPVSEQNRARHSYCVDPLFSYYTAYSTKQYSKPWIDRWKCKDTKRWRYILTLQGMSKIKSLQCKNQNNALNKI